MAHDVQKMLALSNANKFAAVILLETLLVIVRAKAKQRLLGNLTNKWK